MNQKEVIERINRLMSDLGLSQTQFAVKCGINQSCFSNAMSGNRAFGASMVNKAVIATGVNRNWLVTGIGEPFSNDEKQSILNLSETVRSMSSANEKLVEIIHEFINK